MSPATSDPVSDSASPWSQTRFIRLVVFGAAIVFVVTLAAVAVVVVVTGRLAHVRSELEAARREIARLQAEAKTPQRKPPIPALTTTTAATRSYSGATTKPATRPATRKASPATAPVAAEPGFDDLVTALRALLSTDETTTAPAVSSDRIKTAIARVERALPRGESADAEVEALLALARRLLARRAMDRGDLTEAAAQLRPLSGTDARAQVLRGELAARQGDYAAALRALEPALAADPEDSLARFWFGLALMQTGRLDEADSQFAQLAVREPRMPDAPYWRGMIRLQKREDEKALPFFDQAVAIVPDFAPAWEIAGVALAILGKTDEALQRLNEAARLAPNRAEIALAQAVCHARRREREKAQAAMKRALTIEPALLDRVRTTPVLNRLVREDDWKQLPVPRAGR